MNVQQTHGLTIGPLAASGFGATVAGLAPGAITTAQKEIVLEAYRRHHGLLCFEFEDLLSADDLHALTAIFGDNEFAPGLINGIGKKAADGEENISVDDQVAALRDKGRDPYLAFIGNVDPDSLKMTPTDRKFYGEWEWHTDMSYIPVPPTFSLLHARIVPATGGDTGFCSQVLAAAALPDDLRGEVSTLRIKHDATYTSSGVLRPGMSAPASPIEAHGHAHPVLRATPIGPALFLGRRTNAYVVGLPLDESEDLLNRLWAHATQEAFQYHHHWRVGQVVAWDNRMMLHMRHPVDETAARFMWRTQTKGEAVRAVTA